MAEFKLINIKGTCWLVFLILIAGNVYGQNRDNIVRSFSDYQTNCFEPSNLDEILFFKETLEKAEEIQIDFCNNGNSKDIKYHLRVVALLDDLNKLFLNSSDFNSLIIAEEARLRKQPSGANIFYFEKDPIRITVGDNYFEVTGQQLNSCQSVAEKINNSTCVAALDEFKKIYDFIHTVIARPIAQELVLKLQVLEKEWSKFLSESKSQTPLELAVNGYFFKRAEQEYKFMPPPKWQLIFFHPTLIIENVSDAIDGQELKEAIMIEGIGINWWKQDVTMIPSGLSLIGLYSDRSSLKDWRYGAALHFDSKISFGLTYRDESLGILGTVDFLKLLQSNKNTLNKYRDTFNF